MNSELKFFCYGSQEKSLIKDTPRVGQKSFYTSLENLTKEAASSIAVGSHI